MKAGKSRNKKKSTYTAVLIIVLLLAAVYVYQKYGANASGTKAPNAQVIWGQ